MTAAISKQELSPDPGPTAVPGLETRLPYRVLLLNWRDPQHPKAGGAEALTINWAQAWQEAGATVTLLSNKFAGGARETSIGGVRVVRSGNPATQGLDARTFYRREGPFDLVVEEINTLPFFSPFWARERSILLMHQLAREVWFYESRWPLSLAGYVVEPLYLKAYRRRPALVLSQSTRADLIKLGFQVDRVHIVPGAAEQAPAPPLTRAEILTFLYVGRITPSKRIDHIIRAFSLAHNDLHQRGIESKLGIVGSGPDALERKLKLLAESEGVSQCVEFVGWVDHWWREESLARSHILVLASVREGWGLVVTEANSVGIPAIGYPVAGLRDSIQHLATGILTSGETPQELAREMVGLGTSKELLSRLSNNAYEDSKRHDWPTSRAEAVRQLSRIAAGLI
jgi:glycosyltransferase involved in cell wall biosynthesis